jgi:protease I
MAGELSGRNVAILVANEGVEQVELTEPRKALEQAGAITELLSPSPETVQAFHHLDKAEGFLVDHCLVEVSASDYDALLLPGGVANSDALRRDPTAVSFVREFFSNSKPVAAICHAGWMLVEADVVSDRTLTSWPSLRTDITNAGGTWVDREVVVDGSLVTSRKPDDLQAFCSSTVAQFAEQTELVTRPGFVGDTRR